MSSRGPLHRHLTPPTYRIALAERVALLARLRTLGERRVVLLDAPAGYGKTWLLSRWHAELRLAGTAVAWLGVEDSEPAPFLALAIAACAKLGLEVHRLENLAAQGFATAPLGNVVAGLIEALAERAEPLVLFVDDVHRLAPGAVTDVLGRLVNEAPPAVRFVCAGRDCSALPRAALRIRGELAEFGVDDLRFSPDETRELLPDLAPRQLEDLLARTEGWPAALQLARLWLEAKPNRTALLGAFSGRTSEVAGYLTEQVLDDLQPAVRSVLSTVAVLDTLNSELVEAVTGDERAWGHLVEARGLEHFLVPLDEERYWFRLHYLLLDFLRAERRRRAANDRPLHAGASRWFERHGGLREAVQHAVLADDLDRATALIERTGGWELVLFGGTALMRSLLGALPAERLDRFPRILLYKAFLSAKDGDLARGLRLYERIADSISADAGPALARDLLMVGHLIRRYADLPVEPGALDALYRAYDVLAPGDDVSRATLANVACLLALALGDMRAALEAATRAVREMRRIGSVLGLNYCLCHLGLAHWHLGARREAEALWRETVALAEENFGADSGLRAIADLHLALALHARGDVAGARALFDRALPQVETADGWLDLYAEAYELAIANALERGAAAEARGLVERARGTAVRRGLDRRDRLARAFASRVAQHPAAASDAAAADLVRSSSPDTDAARADGWRERHANGIAGIVAALSADRLQAALAPLAELEAAADAGSRRRHQRSLAALRAAVEIAAGAGAETGTLAAFVADLEEAVREDDTHYLVDLGPVLLPLLQRAVAWSRDHGASSSVRQVLAATAATLVRTVDSRSVAVALSARELEVLAELVDGAPNKVIARRLHMTENTVKFHLKNVFQKLGVRHRAEAIQAARTRGVLR